MVPTVLSVVTTDRKYDLTKANARNVSYTPNLTDEKHTILILVDQNQ